MLSSDAELFNVPGLSNHDLNINDQCVAWDQMQINTKQPLTLPGEGW